VKAIEQNLPTQGAAAVAARDAQAAAAGQQAGGASAGRSASTAAQVAILLCTHNGERFLPEQLDSFVAQTFGSWRLVVSDDGSRDGTWELLQRFRNDVGADVVEVRRGPCLGFSRNFLSLACDPSIDAQWFAFADQDDVWLPAKIDRAVEWLKTVDPSMPAMYCGRTISIDESGAELGRSPLFTRPPDFRNALVQSLAGGNTQVINRAARDLLAAAGQVDHVSHDWWFYQLISGSGGLIHYDSEPFVKYRQHGANIVGSNMGWQARKARARELLRGRLQRWNDLNARALASARHLLLPRNQQVLDDFMAARAVSGPRSIGRMRRAGVYRQTMLQDLGLWIAALTGKI
jgi:glycosyltransferase involved in cell wall biosynthesis